MPKSAKEKAEIEFSVPETFRICELYFLWNKGLPEYFKTDKRDGALECMKARMKEKLKKNSRALLNL